MGFGGNHMAFLGLRIGVLAAASRIGWATKRERKTCQVSAQ
jgi:hypothetical protein